MTEDQLKTLYDADNRSKSNTHRLDELSDDMQKNNELIASIRELAVEVKYLRTDVNKMGERMDKIEHQEVNEDAEKWKKFTWKVFEIALSAIMAAVFVKIGLK